VTARPTKLYRFLVARRRVGWFRTGSDDRLSRAVSALRGYRNLAANGRAADAGFDAGEFSGPAWDRLEEKETAALLGDFGFTVATFNAELEARVGGHVAYRLGLYA